MFPLGFVMGNNIFYVREIQMLPLTIQEVSVDFGLQSSFLMCSELLWLICVGNVL
jgi:hypothetical protein